MINIELIISEVQKINVFFGINVIQSILNISLQHFSIGINNCFSRLKDIFSCFCFKRIEHKRVKYTA
jgi:hypothetical protein